MKPVFADTSFYVAISSPQDALHAQAKALAGAQQGPILTSEFVLVEVGNFFCRGSGRSMFQTLVRNLRSAEGVEIVPVSTRLFEKALALFTSRPDKDWSLTDCGSFVVMTEHGSTEALTADHHFEQAGFVALLK
ncbi:MAG: PIN domain-containing protein [Gemmataceae bacterium]